MNLGATIIKSRRSVRTFTDKPISEEIIKETLECGRLAPTAMNLQPWLLGVITDRDLLKKVADITDHGKFIADAAACFVVCGDKKAKYYLEDCCAATMNMITCLQGFGVGTCWVAGDKKEYGVDICKHLEIPGEYSLVSLIPAGYPKEVEVPKKKPGKEIFFTNRWKPEES
ncbi:MAG TPA: nitroreductase family protein [Methanospirillum sp.]|jgi:nitroreductase|uniref:nitroreductase family protein n=1 Tax=Methanospirillum sp. TaxID=45200 RepID=UPI001BD5491E|nr:nitroreductase family protein [Methanospirillum sp.]MCZ2417284.1 nitroreductase family protein [Burkholderiales bacterium]HPY59720.1 nitroreductase family protein [Methanospirillum sp.]